MALFQDGIEDVAFEVHVYNCNRLLFSLCSLLPSTSKGNVYFPAQLMLALTRWLT